MHPMVRTVLEKRYSGTCTVFEQQDSTDPDTGIVSQQEVVVLADQPCYLSTAKATPANQTDTAAAIGQEVKLFLAPECTIHPGSRMVVLQNGITEHYRSSGQPRVYETHQEIALVLEKEFA